MIGIIVPSNLKYAPYVQYYVKKLKEDNIKYEIITWNRKDITEENSNYTFNFSVNDSERKKVLFGYLKFSLFVNKIIKKRKYDKIIVFTIAAAFFSSNILLKKYPNKYIFDIRDASIISVKMKKIFKKLCDNAYSIVVSSPEFNKWIDKKTIMSHNVDKNTISNHIEDSIKHKKTKVNSIVFAGILNEWEINNELVQMFKNNPKYNFGFIGMENEGKKKLENNIKLNNINNVFFEGTYNKDEIIDIYREKATFVNIIRKECTINAQAIPNKLYDAALSGIPIIILKHNTSPAKIVEKYKLGVVLNSLSVKEIEKKLSEFEEKEIKSKKYLENRNKFLSEILKDINIFEKILNNFIMNKEG